MIIFRQRREVVHIQDASSPNTNNEGHLRSDALWRRSAPSPAKSTQPMPALGMIQWEGSAVGTRTSNEEILEATQPATWVGRARIDREHYDGPTSMERLQAHHDRVDKLARVHTHDYRNRSCSTLRSRQSDCSMKEEMMWTDYPRRAKRTSLFAIRERELLAAQHYAPARSRRGRG